MKIGNIVFKDELINHNKVDYINYIQQDVKHEILDKNVPTLYVGWKFLKEINVDNDIIQKQDILDKNILNNQLYWEFSFEENKGEHINGVENFVNNVPKYFFNEKYMYVNLDPIFFNIKSLDDLYKKLPLDFIKVFCYKNEMLYLLYHNKITGIDLKSYDFLGFDIITIKSDIQKVTTQFIDDLDGSLYKKEIKIFPNFSNLKRFLVVIL